MYYPESFDNEWFLWILFILLLLGVWKFVEILIWFFSHLAWV